jgi:CheY-like chemotaxis protein/Tfp pilus assembly protein PilZ
VRTTKILAVDDSPVALHKYQIILSHYTVVTATNGLKALAELERHIQVDLIILDINMPLMNGLEFLRALRKEPKYERIPVIVVSSEGRESDASRALGLGAQGYLTKPFPSRELQRMVAAHVRLPKLRAQPAPAPQRTEESLTQPTSGAKRIPCGEPCDIIGAGGTWHGLVWNLSVKGLYVVLAVPFKIGDTLKLQFSLPGDPAVITCAGKVAWINAPVHSGGSGAVAPHLPAGYGLEFDGLDEADRTRIDVLVRSRAAVVGR